MSDLDFGDRLVTPERPRRPKSYYQRFGVRIWPLLADYRFDLKHVPHLCDALRQAREAEGLTRRQLASATDCSRCTIDALENGTRAPSLALAERLIEALRLPLEVAIQLRAESVVPRSAAAYVKPWQRWPGYQPQPSRRLGLNAASDPDLQSQARQPVEPLPRFVLDTSRYFRGGFQR